MFPIRRWQTPSEKKWEELCPGRLLRNVSPGDMGMSFGDPEQHDPPYLPEMDNARNIVKSACDKAGLTFLDAAAIIAPKARASSGVDS